MQTRDPDESPKTPYHELSMQPTQLRRLMEEEALAAARTQARMRLRELETKKEDSK